MTIQICHVLNAWEAKKPLYGTKNLSKGAKTRVRVLADIQNFALRAHCVHGIPLVGGPGGLWLVLHSLKVKSSTPQAGSGQYISGICFTLWTGSTPHFESQMLQLWRGNTPHTSWVVEGGA